ncbi:MAG TPA: ABC transporter permease [Thermomicrobiales bacterium]|nr:ABC transporter permease [Thermomicrobiales bacterium]
MSSQPRQIRSGLVARIHSVASPLITSVVAVLIALLVGAIIILLSGQDPVTAFRALFTGAFGDKRAIGETLVLSSPLLFAGLAFAVAFRAGMFNIGAEGQLIMGGLAAGIVGAWDLHLPLLIHLPLALLAAAIVGGIWGGIPGVMKARTGAHEVITTIMFNYLAYEVNAYAVNEAGSWLPVNPMLQATDPVRASAKLPNILPGTRLHAGFLLALVAAVILWYLLFRTTFGYQIRTVGLSRGAAAYAGISWGRTVILAMFASGLLAGLGGAGETLGLQGRHYNIQPGYGFTAIAVSLVGRNHPYGIILAALLFGMLRSGATEMQNVAGTSKELVQVLQALVILAVSAVASIEYLRARRRHRRPADASAPATIGMGPDVEQPVI